MHAQIAGVILRSKEAHLTARFYEILGLKMDYHAHGGPLHYELGPNSRDIVLEIYRESDNFDRDAVMVEVPSIVRALVALKVLSINPRTELKETPTFSFFYVTDPDGRDVMLIEKK